MKRLIALAASLFLGLGIAVAPPAAADARNDRLFVKTVTAEAPDLRGISLKTMVKTAKSTCKFLRAGFGALDAVEMMENAGFSENASITFVAGSIAFYCPDQENNV